MMRTISVFSCPHGSHGRLCQGVDCRSRWLSRKRTELGGTAPRSQAARIIVRSQDRCWRRGSRILGLSSQGLLRDKGATLLGAQDCQSPEQDAHDRAAESQGRSARDLAFVSVANCFVVLAFVGFSHALVGC